MLLSFGPKKKIDFPSKKKTLLPPGWSAMTDHWASFKGKPAKIYDFDGAAGWALGTRDPNNSTYLVVK